MTDNVFIWFIDPGALVFGAIGGFAAAWTWKLLVSLRNRRLTP